MLHARARRKAEREAEIADRAKKEMAASLAFQSRVSLLKKNLDFYRC